VLDEWQVVRHALRVAGVEGIEDLGRFVNNTEFLRPSRLDERAAAPVLLDLLPELTDPQVVAAVGCHLQRPWVRPDGYEVVLAAFKRWATRPGEAGWVLGDTLARAADKSRARDFLELAADDRYGEARWFVVGALWRFKAAPDVESLLRRLVTDPEVALMAMTALQRVIGPDAMIVVLRQVLDGDPAPRVREQAQRQLKRIERKLARKP
jgi:hypothetical protein